MAIEDPGELDRVDREIRRNELRELGAELSIGEECPPEVESEFLARVRAFEEGPFASVLDRLARRGCWPPAPDALSDEEVTEELWRLIHELAALHVFLSSTDHLSDRELYEHLLADSLREEYPDLPAHPDSYTGLDILGGCSEEDLHLWLKHYASEDDRRRWADEFPADDIPAHEPARFDRDRRLPQPPF